MLFLNQLPLLFEPSVDSSFILCGPAGFQPGFQMAGQGDGVMDYSTVRSIVGRLNDGEAT